MSQVLSTELVSRYGCVERNSGQGVDSARDLGALTFTGVAPLSLATPETLSFLTNEKYLDEATASRAGGVLCAAGMAASLEGKFKGRVYVCAEPYVVFARVAQVFFKPVHPFSGQSAQASVDTSARVDPSATVFPFVFIGPGAVVGPRTVLYSGTFVGAASELGADCIVYPNAVVREGCRLGDRCIVNAGAVIGGDGFGFAPSGMENVKIPQVGGVRMGDDVEVGSNASIDRGAMADTEIGAQTKIDSLVQIGHNVVVGKACFLAGQTGIAGSSKIGNRVTLAGQVGVVGHIEIGDFVTVLAKSGVSKSLPEKGYYNGVPCKPNRDYLRELATLNRMLAKEGSRPNAGSRSTRPREQTSQAEE